MEQPPAATAATVVPATRSRHLRGESSASNPSVGGATSRVRSAKFTPTPHSCHFLLFDRGISRLQRIGFQTAANALIADAPYAARVTEPRIIADPLHPAFGQFGLFAKVTIPRQTVIMCYGGFVQHHGTFPCSQAYTMSYAGTTDNMEIDSEFAGNLARFANDPRGVPGSPQANVQAQARTSPLGEVYSALVAKRTIAAGEELLLSYGPGHRLSSSAWTTEDGRCLSRLRLKPPVPRGSQTAAAVDALGLVLVWRCAACGTWTRRVDGLLVIMACGRCGAPRAANAPIAALTKALAGRAFSTANHGSEPLTPPPAQLVFNDGCRGAISVDAQTPGLADAAGARDDEAPPGLHRGPMSESKRAQASSVVADPKREVVRSPPRSNGGGAIDLEQHVSHGGVAVNTPLDAVPTALHPTNVRTLVIPPSYFSAADKDSSGNGDGESDPEESVKPDSTTELPVKQEDECDGLIGDGDKLMSPTSAVESANAALQPPASIASPWPMDFPFVPWQIWAPDVSPRTILAFATFNTQPRVALVEMFAHSTGSAVGRHSHTGAVWPAFPVSEEGRVLSLAATRDFAAGAEVCWVGGVVVHEDDDRVGTAPLQLSLTAAAREGSTSCSGGDSDPFDAAAAGSSHLQSAAVAPRLALLATNEASCMCQTGDREVANVAATLRRDALGCQYVAAVALRPIRKDDELVIIALPHLRSSDGL